MDRGAKTTTHLSLDRKARGEIPVKEKIHGGQTLGFIVGGGGEESHQLVGIWMYSCL
jgi:hypothetical protein